MSNPWVADRYFALAGRPVMQVRNAAGDVGVREMHPATGAFLPSYALYTRLREGAVDLDELDRAAFLDLVADWRQRLALRRRSLPIRWSPTDDIFFPWRAEQDGQPLLLRANPYPPDPQFSVMAADQAVDDFEEWPPAWQRG